MSEIFFAVYICADCQLLGGWPYLSVKKACDVCIFCVFVGFCIRSGLFLPQSCCRSRVVSFFCIVLCCVFCIVLFQGLCVVFCCSYILYNVYVFCVFCVRCFSIYCVVIFFLRFFYSCDMFGFHVVVYVFMFFMYCCVVKKVVWMFGCEKSLHYFCTRFRERTGLGPGSSSVKREFNE